MIALRLVRLIESNADRLADELLLKCQASPRTRDLRNVPEHELKERTREIYRNLSEWLLTKTEADIERRYLEIGARRAAQDVSLADFCWAVMLSKEHLWEFLSRQGYLRNAMEIYGELELLRLLDQFFDRALCYATEGYERARKDSMASAV